MKISNEKPPIYDEANALFRLDELKLGTIFTYGDTLYNPSNMPISEDLVEHEMTHAHQQQHDETVAGLWWKRYIDDPQFRLDQEVEAYAQQYKFLCKTQKDRNKRARMLHQIATMLSGPMYGNIVTHTEAMRRVREYASGVR